MSWLPDDFEPPARLDLATGHHLRPIRAADVDIDMVAVMGSQERLFSLFGPVWGWPPATMTREQDLEDLEYHEDEMRKRSSYNYAVLDAEETQLLGCVYVDPPDTVPGADAEIAWWVVDDAVGTDLERTLAEDLPRWVADSWPFRTPTIIGRDLTFAQWAALQDRPGDGA
ncbi:GNAT family N-acetyltransferase [Actinotalea sp. Marseille-Q4924]|uniref:GNAT family N-acetyltransferase n=1 Tax=Actinotalea sp. Marseille-Q4924 TaxID=2866571 RepID=UPI001CE42486|nr:GNAT family N-acetyltransferase [Actinotalea sp. Marseille-Q4924]